MNLIICTPRSVTGYFICAFMWILVKSVSGEEICTFEKFSPTCEDSHVINITKATYGRMRIGRCVKMNRGSLGCQMDVTSYFDRKCSGRDSCHVDIPVADLSQELECLNDLGAHLEIEYECVKVYIPDSAHCISSHDITVSGVTGHQSHFLSSAVSQKTQCGLHKSPWTIKAQKGQTIQLQLLDFSWTTQPGQEISGGSQCQQRYGYILDIETDDVINICGGWTKERLLFVSQGHTLQIVFESNPLDEHVFLIKYEVLGCPDFTHLPNTWLEKDNGTITVGCITSSDTWRLKCVQNGWLGYIGNCSASYDGEVYGEAGREGKSGWSFSDNHVLAFTIGCVTVITCCVTVIAGYYCVRKYEIRNRQRETVVSPTILYDDGTLASTHSSVFYRPAYTTNNTLTKHGLLLNQPNPVHSSTMRPPLVPERTTSLTRPSKKVRSPPQNIMPYNNNNCKFINENTYCSNSMRIQNNPMFHHGVERSGGEPQYFVLETPRESVSDDREQLYQSIHLRSTSSSVSD